MKVLKRRSSERKPLFRKPLFRKHRPKAKGEKRSEKSRFRMKGKRFRIKKANSHESKIYSEFSHLYERIFTRFFGPRINATIRSLSIPPDANVLEMGVGTGLSLGAYPTHSSVTAIDLSQGMLDQAQEKIENNGWDHIRLRQMDATTTGYPDGHFDYVMAFHLVSVVPEASRLMEEILRVCKPGGTIVIINHFRSKKRWLAPLVDMLDPATRKLGWRTTLRFSELFDDSPIQVQHRFKTSKRSLFTVVVALKPEECENPG